MNTDPRFLRSQRQLYTAVLKLASENPPDSITVTAIAQEADVHRSTVYDHAESPTELLRQALYVELDELRETYIVNGTGFDTLTELMLGVADHMERFEDIYRHMSDKEGTHLREILSSHFVGSIHLMFHNRQVELPDTTADLEPEDIFNITMKAMCETNVSILVSWLETAKPRKAQDALELMNLLSPPWLTNL